MTLDELKQWAILNKKGLIVGGIAGFILSRLLK